MATKFILKKSSVASSAPVAGDLEPGEIAINLADKKLYSKTVGGTVIELADGDKLAGIEAGADVTDTANVTAAGALMDSEVTNLAAVKAFDPANYAAAAHTHAIADVTNLQSSLDAKLSLSGGTMTGSLSVKGVVENTGTMPSGTTPAIDPANGTVQEWSLSGNSSPADSLADGEFVELLIQDGTAYSITWPTITWLTDGGTAPTLKTSGVTPVLVQKVGSTLYGRRTGNGG